MFFINFGRWSGMVVGPFGTLAEAQKYQRAKIEKGSRAYKDSTVVEAKPPLGPIVTLTVRLQPWAGRDGAIVDVGEWWAEKLTEAIKDSAQDSIFREEFQGVDCDVEQP